VRCDATEYRAGGEFVGVGTGRMVRINVRQGRSASSSLGNALAAQSDKTDTEARAWWNDVDPTVCCATAWGLGCRGLLLGGVLMMLVTLLGSSQEQLEAKKERAAWAASR